MSDTKIRFYKSVPARLLTGLGAVFVLSLAAVICGPALGWVTEDFAGQLARIVFPALLAVGGIVFGASQRRLSTSMSDTR